ncbi:L-ascorbate oxidase [Coprinopsis sp. MPI-PUGE-AT-0042]|nr:L-ascorbate oxidase [Coprinopsis sp. MPI-PUGE-AT-0042]
MSPAMSSKALLLLSISSLGLAYRYPDLRYEALEALIYEGRTTAGSSLAALVHPCRKRIGSSASVPAEWLRFAFHDMATHNAEEGTGGMDGSLVYELDRAENFGSGFITTLGDFENFPNKYLSRADIIAAGAVHSVATCGGPVIPFRGGRIDTFQAGGFGTPEPHQDIETIQRSFTTAGFSQSEMIKLVACGHTMGGVRSDAFPQLVPAPASGLAIHDFDTSPEFDNKVATEYLDGTTQNPLVVSSNATLVSDLHVFSSDGNKTISDMASPDAFKNECRDILGRMLDVVPRGVTLTEEITMIPAKVKNAQITIEKDQLVFKSTFRLAQPTNKTASKDRVVTMFWCDRYGPNKDCEDSSRTSVFVKKLAEDPNISPVTMNQGWMFNSYDFVVPINATQSVSKFWFEVDEKDGSRATVYNNEGADYVVDQDEVLFMPMLSKVQVITNTTTTEPAEDTTDPEAENPNPNRRRGGGEQTNNSFYRVYDLVVGVRESTTPERVYLDGFDASILRFPYAINTTVELALDDSLPAKQGYKFYTGKIESSGLQLTIDVHGDVGDQHYVQDFMQTGVLDNTPYVAPGLVKTGESRPSSAVRVGSWSAASVVVLSVAALFVGGF